MNGPTYALRGALGAVGLMSFIALAPLPAMSQEITLKAGTSWNDKFPMAEMLNLFKARLAEHSGGRMGMDIHLANSLCSEKTCVEQVKLKHVDIGTATVANYGGFYKTFEVLTLPYIFSDDAAARKVMEGFLHDELAKASVERDGMRIIALVPFLGFRQLQTKSGPIKTPADLRRVKIRVTESPLDGALLRAWGAVATPIDWAETYDALQQNVASGLYIQKGVHAMMKFFEVTPHVTLTGGAWTPIVIFMDQKRYEALPDWGKTAVDKASADLRTKVFEIDQKYSAKLESAGSGKVTYYTPNADEMAQWRQAATRSWQVAKQLKLYDPKLARRILEAQADSKALIAELEKQGSL